MRLALSYISGMLAGAIVSGVFFGIAGATAWIVGSLILTLAGVRL